MNNGSDNIHTLILLFIGHILQWVWGNRFIIFLQNEKKKTSGKLLHIHHPQMTADPNDSHRLLFVTYSLTKIISLNFIFFFRCTLWMSRIISLTNCTLILLIIEQGPRFKFTLLLNIKQISDMNTKIWIPKKPLQTPYALRARAHRRAG